MRPLVRAAVAIAVASIGCNLVFGIEEHDLRAPDAGVEAEAPLPDGAPAATDACTSDVDCHPPNGCYKARCDTTLGLCRYALCEGSKACSAGVCNPSTFTCEDERDYGFRATTYPLATTLGACAKNPSACVGAAYPFLFIGTRDAVVVLRVDDLRATEARTVPVTDLRVRPGKIVASGHRVWIVGDVQGTEPPYTLPIASVDVPSDPTTKQLAAKSALLEYPFPTVKAFPAPDGGLFIAYDDDANPQNLPAALISAPITADGIVGVEGELPDGGVKVAGPPGTPTLVMHRTQALPAGSKLVASSGSRLVAYRFPITFNLITNPGRAEANAQADTTLAPPFPGLVLPRFEQGPDGVVLMTGPIAADPPADCNCTSHQRTHWVFSNAVATSVESSKLIDPEGYVNPLVTGSTVCHTCAAGYFAQPSLVAWIDGRSALVAAPASDPATNRVMTSVRLLERDPLAASAERRFVVPAGEMPTGNFATDRIALTSSSGLGFVVIADTEGNGARLSVYDPRCDTN